MDCSLFVLALLVGSGQAGKFWHISDLHLDYQYNENGDVNNMCHLSSKKNSTETLSPAGNYSCDAPLLLVKSIIKAMQLKEPNPDFIVWTGDNGPHTSDPIPSYKYITKVMRLVYNEIKRLFRDVPVITALGNHDSDPPDSFEDSDLRPDSLTSQYQRYFDDGGFKDHIVEEKDKQTFLKCGYYTRTIQQEKTAMKFVVLNTNLYYNNVANFTEEEAEDPCNQLAWLNETLVSTPEEVKVYIVAHVPPGSFERMPAISFFNSPAGFGEEIEKKYVTLLVQPGIHEKIQAHLYGHVHTDTFRLFLSRTGDDEVRGVGFMASSGTPLLYRSNNNRGVNPGIRLFQYNDDDGSLEDYLQYALMLDQIDLSAKTKPRRKNLDDVKDRRRRRRDILDSSQVSRIDRNSKLLDLNKTYADPEVDPEAVAETTVPPPSDKTSSITVEDESKDIEVNDPTNISRGDIAGDAADATKQSEQVNDNDHTPSVQLPQVNSTVAVEDAVEKKSNNSIGEQLQSEANATDTGTTEFNATIVGTPEVNATIVGTPEVNTTSIETSEVNTTSIKTPEVNGTSAVEIEDGVTDIKIVTEKTDVETNVDDLEDAITKEEEDDWISLIANNFTLLYKATEAFKVDNISADQMGKAYNLMTLNSSLFQDYYDHNTVNHILEAEPCNSTCYRKHMCTIKFQIISELKRCLESDEKLTDLIIASSVDAESAAVTPYTHVPREDPTTVETLPDPVPLPPAETTTKFWPRPPIPGRTRAPPTTPPPQTTVDAKKIEEVKQTLTNQINEEIHEVESMGEVASQPVETGDSRVKSKVAGIFFGVSGALIILLIAGFSIRKYRQRRNNDQEFLLTDAVFRYDGYSQLDDQF